jgi:GNAT superfamily N-acetyltransferase
VIDPKRKFAATGYRHMAIHPYPIEMVADVSLEDGTVLHVRPIRPEDAELERAFVNGLSEQTRYFRFFYRMHELTPAMLARFTQIDYDREVALVAIDAPGGAAVRAGEQWREAGSRGPTRDAQGDATGASGGVRGDERKRASGEQGPVAEGTGMRARASAQGIGAIANRRGEADTQRGTFPEDKRGRGRYQADAGRGARHHEHEEAEAAFVGVARYIANPDHESAEFAVVVADAWQRRGVARMLMQRLIACARLRGLARLEGTVLRENTNMRKFTEALGFVTHDDAQEPEQVTVVLDLT